jgi:hypothetical protein
MTPDNSLRPKMKLPLFHCFKRRANRSLFPVSAKDLSYLVKVLSVSLNPKVVQVQSNKVHISGSQWQLQPAAHWKGENSLNGGFWQSR